MDVLLLNRLGPPAFLVGRERECDALAAHVDAALRGAGRLILLSGEAGIGKTALAAVLSRAAATQGARVLVGRCYDRTETPPYGLWADLFSHYGPADGDPPPPDAFATRETLGTATSRVVLFDQVLDFLRAIAARHPLLLILDDIHWSDPAGLDLMRALARICPMLPLLAIATYRADEVGRDHPLSPLLPLLVREADAARLNLRPLDGGAVRAYVAGRYALPEESITVLAGYLTERTEGNPLFMTELLRALEEEGVLRREVGGWELGTLPQGGVPPLLRQVIEARVGRLGDEGRGLLAVAAVIGQEVPLALWRQVSGAAEGTVLGLVERAVAARVIEETADGAGVTFAHALIREALYEGMAATRRRVWHRTIGEALAAGREPDPDAVGYHLGTAGDERAVEWLIRAGDRANRAFAYRTATARFTDALALIGNDPDRAVVRCELLIRLARLLRITDSGQAIAYEEEALQLATQTGDEVLHAVAQFRLGYLLSYVGQRQRGLTLQLAGLATLDALPPSAMARIAPLEFICTDFTSRHGSVAQRLVQIGRIREAECHAERALAAGGGELNRYSEDAWMALAIVDREMGRSDEGWRRSQEIHTIFRARGEHDIATWLVGSPLIWAALVFRTDDQVSLREMRALLDARAPEPGELFAALPVRLLHLPVLYIEGAWAEAGEIIAAVRRSPFARHTYTHGAWLVHALIAVARGETDAAWAAVHGEFPAGAATEPGNNRYDVGLFYQWIAATLALDMGDLAEARRWLEAHDRWLAWSGALLGTADAHLLWARYHRAVGEDDAARERALAALTAASAPRQPLLLLTAHRLLGELDTAAGRYEAADRHLDAARALAADCRAPYEQALTALARAERFIASGDDRAALALVEEARIICAPLNARPALRRAAALSDRLAHAQARARPAARFPDGLTGREGEVLRFLAAGLSNREIGEALLINGRTAERHISNIYAKIGANSRAEAAAYAVRHGLI
jgi:DNA-binding CsgD family transcriptional regulator